MLLGECVCRGAVEIAGFHGDGRNLHFFSPDFYSMSGEAVREKSSFPMNQYLVWDGEVGEVRGLQ